MMASMSLFSLALPPYGQQKGILHLEGTFSVDTSYLGGKETSLGNHIQQSVWN